MNQSRMASPAMLVAALALVAAFAATAIAGPDVLQRAITKKKVKKIATKQINKLAPGLSVAHAETAGAAGDAGSIDGLDSSQLQRAGLVDHAQRSATSTTPLTLFSWPQLGVAITTDGTADADAEVRIVATGVPGANIDLAAAVGGFANLGNSFSTSVGAGPAFHGFAVWDRNEPTRMWSITCASANAGTVNCIGLRSRPD
jgi:hypothetical protein